MDNNQKTFKNISKMYDKLTYFDKYGSSILLLIIITILLILGVSYCFIMINVQVIRDNWVNERCKPYIMPFASFINKPSDVSFMDYTEQNFQYCTQNVVKGFTSEAVQPITFVVHILNSFANAIKNAINSVRAMIDKVRTNLQSVTEEVMGRLMNIMIPLQQIIISARDMISKIQGVMTATLYTLLGSYYTLQSLMGAIAEFIIIILIALAVIIMLLWILPFTWGAAAAMTAIFLAIAIPLAIIVVFMTDVLHVRPDLSIPSVQCFDENTLIKMKDGSKKNIIDISVGDELFGGDIVTTKIVVPVEGSTMYNLNGVIVSNSHLVKYKDKWLRVSQHPDSKKLDFYDKNELYCLNTRSKKIIINDTCFSDWDDLLEKDINNIRAKIIDKFKLKNTQDDIINIHKYINSGFSGNTILKLINGQSIQMKDIKLGCILENGEKVIGLVEIDGLTINDQYTFHLGNNINIVGGLNLYSLNNNSEIMKFIDLDEKYRKKNIIKQEKLFHLLTDSKTFTIKNIKFYDYNASVDLFLEKI